MQPPEAYIPCLYCQRGPKGFDPNPCSGMQNIRSLKAGGCFIGQVIPGKEKLLAKFHAERARA